MSVEHPSPVLDTAAADATVERLAREHREDIGRIEALDYHDNRGTAQLILVLLGEQPAMDIYFAANDRASADQAVEVLRRAGLSVLVGRTESGVPGTGGLDADGEVLAVFVAKTQELAAQIRALRTDPDAMPSKVEEERYGQLMGFPQTAINAFVGRAKKLTYASEPAVLKDPKLFLRFVFSKDHWKEELAVLRRRCLMIKKYAPELHDKLVGDR